MKRIKRLLDRRGLGFQSDPDDVDPLLLEQPLLAELYGASVQGRVATGSKAGERIATVGFEEEEHENKKGGRRCANMSGFSLHANVAIPSKARHQLEMLWQVCCPPAGGDGAPLEASRWPRDLSAPASMAQWRNAYDI